MSRLFQFAVLFLCFAIQANAQEYNFIKYNVQDGLPQSQVYDIFQDSKSYLWMATQGGGVCRFDGKGFETVTTRNGLPSNFVECIFEDKDNVLWFGTKTGLASYDHKKINWSEKTNRIIYSIAQKEDGDLFLGTQAGLLFFDMESRKSSKLQLEPYLDISRINDILHVGEEWWIASSRGLFILDGERVKRIGIDQGLLAEDIKSLCIDEQGFVLVLQFAGGLSKIDSKSKKVHEGYGDPEIQKGQNLFVSKENEIWVSTLTDGIQVFNPNSSAWFQIGEQEGLTHSNVKEVFEDSWGNIWIATSGGGMLKYLGQYFKHYNKSQGLIGNRIYSIEETSSGDLWLSVGQYGISVIDSTGIRNNIDSALINTKCNHIFEDSEQRMWMSTSEEGLVLKDTLGFRSYTTENGLSSNWIKSVNEDSLGYLWVATFADGLMRIKSVDSIDLEISLYGTAQGLPDLLMNGLQVDPLGRVWYITKKGGIGYAFNNKITDLTRASGLPRTALRSIAFDSLKNVWIATGESGIYQASYLDQQPKFKKLETVKGLSSDNIYSLQFDPQGNLWAGSEVGVDKISFNASGVVLDVQHFGRNEGFLGVETCQNSVKLDSKGFLWFGTLNGLSRHKPGSTELSISKPKLHFTGIDLGYKDIKLSEHGDFVNKGDSLDAGLKLKYNENDIGFNFQALYPDQPEGIKYFWKLVGLDDAWSLGSNASAVNYTNVPPGNYTFRVKAKSLNGEESNELSSSFEISPAFWQRPLFQILMALLGALILFSFFYFRVRRIKKKEKKKREELELKNELLSLEQKALQLQMNPHFIFNALNSIQALVVKQENELARDQIQTFAGLMRGILTNSKSERISLKEEYTTLDKYLKMEQFCQAAPFDFEISLPKEYDPEEIELPPMLIQPFVENSVFHGISHLNKKGKIQVDFIIQDELLICEIIDNGVGRKRARELEREHKKGHQSVALEVTEKRLEALKDGKKYTAFEILDILDKNGDVNGTRVVLKLPLELDF